jgi:hypothetical protein
MGADKQAWKNDEEVGKAYTVARGLVLCNHRLLTLRLQRLLADRAHRGERPGDRAEIEHLERELGGWGRPGTTELEEEGETLRKRLDALLKVLVDVQPGMADRVEQTWRRFEREAELNGGAAIVHLVRWEKQTGDELERLLAPLLAGDDAG